MEAFVDEGDVFEVFFKGKVCGHRGEGEMILARKGNGENGQRFFVNFFEFVSVKENFNVDILARKGCGNVIGVGETCVSSMKMFRKGKVCHSKGRLHVLVLLRTYLNLWNTLL